jgi:hypothetical protein
VTVSCCQLAPGIDIKSDGGYVIAPALRTPVGAALPSERDDDVPRAPDWLMAMIQQKQGAQAHAGDRGDQPHKINVDDLRISDEHKNLIREGKPKGSRSEALFVVLRVLVKAGYGDDDIVGVLMDPANAISEKPRELGLAWLQQDIKRARDKPDRDEQPHSDSDSQSSGDGQSKGDSAHDWLKRFCVTEEQVKSMNEAQFIWFKIMAWSHLSVWGCAEWWR